MVLSLFHGGVGGVGELEDAMVASDAGEGRRGGGDLLVNVVEEAGGGLPHDFGI